MKGEAESINNFKFLIELSITQFSEFFKFKLLKNSLALAANSFTTYLVNLKDCKNVLYHFEESLRFKF